MYCRNCGSQVNDKAEFCLKCGVRPLNAKAYCQECGVETNENQEICIKCGVRLKTSTSSKGITLPNGLPLEIDDRVFGDDAYLVDFSSLPTYYQKEFEKIRESKGEYKGKFNWAAFFFGALWALSKGMIVVPLIVIIASIFTGGIVGIIYWIYIAFRGNYSYYKCFVNTEIQNHYY